MHKKVVTVSPGVDVKYIYLLNYQRKNILTEPT